MGVVRGYNIQAKKKYIQDNFIIEFGQGDVV